MAVKDKYTFSGDEPEKIKIPVEYFALVEIIDELIQKLDYLARRLR